jgi:ribosome-binding factor A
LGGPRSWIGRSTSSGSTICDYDDMTKRTEKVQKLAQEVLGESIQALKDPRIGFVTVTGVRISADLRHARVFVSVLGSDDEQRATMAGLESAKAHLRSDLGRQMRMKYLPELIFELDHSPEEAQRMEELFRRIHEETDTQ